ncbi:ROK family protein [Hydrocarboniphaga effusa]|uniref:ROK family transcriptional regulator n=1 Tax=Hydrocarboniphaga effusa TaxID=243629 RepID=UPI003BAB5C43
MATRVGQGRNSINLRRYNERLVLQVLRRVGPASKADLARRTNLANSAIGNIVQALENDGLVELKGRMLDGQRGQPATLLMLNPKGAFGVGVRLDRELIETVLTDFNGEILTCRVHRQLLPLPQDALKLVCRDIKDVLKVIPPRQRERLAGIGLAQPYNLGAWLNELGYAGKDFLPWDDYDFAAELSRATGIPVFSENDANAAVIAELFYGCGRRFDDFAYVFMGAVIGGGAVIAGECLLGASGNACDIAVMPVPSSTLPSARPNRAAWDILLSRASLNALERHLRHSGLHIGSNVAELEPYVAQRHPAVMEWLDDCVDALAPALRSIVCLLDVPVLVIDSDVDAGLIDCLMERLRNLLQQQAPEARSVPEFVRGTFGSDAGAVGAACLPMFFSYSPRAEILRGSVESIEADHAG